MVVAATATVTVQPVATTPGARAAVATVVVSPPSSQPRTALPGETVTLTVPDGATVTLTGVTPPPPVIGTGTTRSFVAPIRGTDTTLVATVTAGGTTTTIPVLVAGCPERVFWAGTWSPAYRTVGTGTTGPAVMPVGGLAGGWTQVQP